MTDNISEVTLLPAVERQHEQIELEQLAEKEQNNPQRITLKSGDTFLVADISGDLLTAREEMGLYHHGTRFLRTCNLYLEGYTLEMLSHQVAEMGNSCHIDLTNAPFTAGPERQIEQGVIHIDRYLELEQGSLTQILTITNFHASAVPLTLSLKVNADFCDLFEVRGFRREQRGKLLPVRKSNNELVFSYRGLDEIERASYIQFEPATEYIQAERIDWKLQLERNEPVTIRLTCKMGDGSAETLLTQPATTLWHEQVQPSIQTDDILFNQLLKRGMNDLMMLSTMTPHGFYPYAGIPWFSCPFGRDGLIAALEFLPWYPKVARGTIELLAAYQGKKVDPFTEEEPGKIMHEFRTGEMANLREIPYIPYYGTIDATPLFLITLEAYIRWTNDLTFLERLWPHAEAAARWLTDYGDSDGDSLIEYSCISEKGLSNQCWKDSWDAVMHGDGRLAHAPKALSEVQGYAYAAYRTMSTLAEQLGKHDEATYWSQTADTLQKKFLQAFWWEQEHVLYEALADHKEACDVVTSNAGQCLWTGILPDEQAQQVIKRMMSEDMFSGWGIRTLSTHEQRYNPMSYHNGSVWPHDTAFIGAGCALYGRKAEAGQILKSLYDASQYFPDARLPELYCGFTRRPGYGPTRYPVSCAPQAWAAGAPFILFNNLLGLHPNAAERRLTLHQPTLPEWLNSVEISGIYVGAHHVHLRFIRVGERTEVVLGKNNEVDVRIL